MNHNTLNLIDKLNDLVSQQYYSFNLKKKVSELNYFANECMHPKDTLNVQVDYQKEIKGRIFWLLETIPSSRSTSSEFITLFSDLLICYIEASKEEDDLSDLLSAIDSMSISFNIDSYLSKLKI